MTSWKGLIFQPRTAGHYSKLNLHSKILLNQTHEEWVNKKACYTSTAQDTFHSFIIKLKRKVKKQNTWGVVRLKIKIKNLHKQHWTALVMVTHVNIHDSYKHVVISMNNKPMLVQLPPLNLLRIALRGCVVNCHLGASFVGRDLDRLLCSCIKWGNFLQLKSSLIWRISMPAFLRFVSGEFWSDTKSLVFWWSGFCEDSAII